MILQSFKPKVKPQFPRQTSEVFETSDVSHAYFLR